MKSRPRLRRIIFVYDSSDRLFGYVSDWSKMGRSSDFHGDRPIGTSSLLTVWENFVGMQPCSTDFVRYCDAGDLLCAKRGARPPLVLVEHDGGIEIVATGDDIDGAGGVAGLMVLLQARLEEWMTRAAARGGVRRHDRT